MTPRGPEPEGTRASTVVRAWGDSDWFVHVTASAGRIVRAEFVRYTDSERDSAEPVLRKARDQIRRYFDGSLRTFDLPLEPAGSEFAKSVWREVAAIGYGELRSYGEIAAAIGSPRAAVAVGAANGANPIALIIPCHRVIGAAGDLRGYAYGLDLKRRLLDFEGARSVSRDSTRTSRLF